MDTTTYLPGMGPHATLSAWIETHETLLASVLLTRNGAGMRALFVSQDARGDCLLRLCEGADDGWMVWIDQRRTRSRFGTAYADALANAWLDRLEAAGWRIGWSARRTPAVAGAPLTAAA
ncbi:hypothetical protein SAMN04488120_101165 [Fontimonas thermophila]|uniref:Uncharacterized protein n=1 Tax=Fontimonas thermophila TaxID=1076937 RepID=A0A1I2H3X3_9GAMM|nr:hypothetical protein [Fontimonas thermophila]SFF24934.1 hypothetical protein SAMN04488120_101165 [Fontimonas thermophila]